MPPVRRLRERAALRLETAALVKMSAGLGCEAVSPRRVCKFRAADHSVTHVSSRGFGCAAGFCMFQLWVQEGAAASTLPTTHQSLLPSLFLHIGNVIVRRQDTPRARVQVVEPFVGDLRVLRVAQVPDSRRVLPGPVGEECVLHVAESNPIS